MPPGVPYWRLASFYAGYFAAIGILLPFLGLYLRDRGFEPVAIGQLVAVLLSMRIVTPVLWAWLADRWGHRTLIIRVMSATAPVFLAGIVFADSFQGVAISLALFGCLWSGVLPQYEANTLLHLGEQPQRYGSVRLWGSAGFIAAAILGGAYFSGDRVAHVPVVLLALLGLTAVAANLTPGAPDHAGASGPKGLAGILRRREVAGLLLACILLQASFGPYYVFFTIYLREIGYSAWQAGLMWAWGVAAEIVVFAYTPRLLQRWSAHVLLTGALVATVVRWIWTGWFPGSTVMLVLAQTLHMAGFGIFHAAAVQLVHRYFGGGVRNRGQALYSSLGFGLGGGLGSLTAGYLWQLGNPVIAWSVAAAVAAMAALVVVVSSPVRRLKTLTG
jgi:PPP family 3-phenylpropionic acid transporter